MNFTNSSLDSFEDLAIDHVTEFVNLTTTTPRPQPPGQPINGQALLHAMLMNFPEYRLATSINFYGYITEVVVGSVANILALIVMLGLTHLPICNYMASLALVDLIVLLVPCLLRWLLTVDIDPRPANAAACKILNFMSHWSFNSSAWILVAMTVDRYIAITFPLKAIRLSTPRRARIVIGILILSTAAVSAHFFVTAVVETQPVIQEPLCVGHDKFKHFLEVTWPWIDATLYSFIPFAFLLVFNFLIIRSHRRSLAVTSLLKAEKVGEKQLSISRATRRITVTLLVVAFAFIIMTAPKVILTIIRPAVFNFKPAPNKTDFQILAQYTLAASLVNLLLYGNHSINFFLYVLTGRKFREQLLNTFTHCRRRRLRRIKPAVIECSSTETNVSSSRNSRSFSTEEQPAAYVQCDETSGAPKANLVTVSEIRTREERSASIIRCL